MNNQPTQRIMVLLPGRSATDCQQLQVYMEGAGLQISPDAGQQCSSTVVIVQASQADLRVCTDTCSPQVLS